MKKALTTISLALSVTLVGQNNTSILFRGGSEPPAANFSESYRNKTVENSSSFNGKVWLVLQFNALPTEEQWRSLDQLGVERLDYMPSHAFIVSLPVGFEFNTLKDFGVSSVIELQPHHKMEPSLFARPFPEHAISGTDVRVVLGYYENLSREVVLQQLSELNITVERVAAYGNSVTIIVDPARLETIAALPWVMNMELPSPPSTPDDTEARSLHRSNMLEASYATGRHYDGTGVSGAIGDDGTIGPHIDYQGRLDQSTVTGNSGTHGDMTSGIMMGAGNIDPRIKGHAAGLFLYYFDIANYTQIVDAPNLHNNFGVMVTSTSYSQGCNGGYTIDTRDGDQMIRQNPSLIHVFSCGNAGGSDCGYGAGGAFGNITGGYKQGKNVIACGNLNNLDVLESSSSRGPASDGRVKPDICANGFDQLSTDGPNTYQVGGGTSAASPSVAGVVAQLYHAYRDLNSGADPESSLIKACMLNTAEDLGNAGPDYSHGWGRVNAFKAVRTLELNRYLSGFIATGGNNTHNLVVPAGTKQLRVMCYWMDYEGTPLSAKALVNNLDFRVVDPSSTTILPWILDPTPNVVNLSAPAVHGIDTLNNMEQVTIDNPVAGTYQLRVAGTAVPQGPQKYWIVYEFVNDEITVTYPNGGEGFVAGETEILRWEAYGNTGQFTLEYSLNNGANWTTITTTLPGASRQYTWTVAAGPSGQALIRVSRNAVSDISDATFSIIGVPQNIIIDAICPTFTRISWDAVPGATGYEVSMLGAKYMDSIGFTTSLFFQAMGVLPSDTAWFSVRAYSLNSAKGRRAIAFQKLPGTACPTPDDAAIAQVLSPAGGVLTSCMDIDSMSVVIIIENSATNNLTNIPVRFSLDGGPTVSETYNGTLLPFETDTFTFTAVVNLSSAGSHNLKVWTSYPGDTDLLNDTADVVINVTAGTLVSTFPYNQNFETFSNCNPAFDCELAFCNMSSGWLNVTNGSGDNIDWHTFTGSTPSDFTGPDTDFNLGTTAGKYVYLEASMCFGREGLLVSPCFDLTNNIIPVFSFAYHMYGSTVADLHIDVLVDGAWSPDVWSISGNQGNQWFVDTIDLSAYQGKVVIIRFRGSSGSDYDSDIAIDNINLMDFGSPPSADFTQDVSTNCTGQTVQFSDASQNPTTGWLWQFSPGTITFVSGTSANSQDPVVQFNAAGIYDVTLISSNTFGSDTITKTSLITIGDGATLPIYEDFESNTACSEATNCGQTVCPLTNGWLNATNGVVDDHDWRVDAGGTPTAGSGPDQDHDPGTASGFYVYLEASNGCNGAEAYLISPCIDLSVANGPRIAYWYHMFGVAMGQLHVDVLAGPSWTLDVTPVKTGNQGNVWLNDTIDLSAYVGGSIKIRFRGITGTASTSDLALDDIGIFESGAPTAAFSASSPKCVDSAITFTDQSTGVAQTYSWVFGSGATPPNASTQGPHVVTYATAGNKATGLTVTNAIGSSTLNQNVVISNIPSASFNFVTNSLGAVFTQASSGATSYFWDFGDGDTSSLAEPAHIYATGGTYIVTMIATNACGSDTSMSPVTVEGNGIAEPQAGWFDIIPNPSNGDFLIRGDRPFEAGSRVEVTDVSGRIIHSVVVTTHATEVSVSLKQAAASVYLVKVSSAEGVVLRKLVIQ